MICVLIAALSALVVAVREYILRRRIRRAEKTADGAFLLTLSGLLARVAMADGQATTDEVETAERIFTDMGLADAERAMCVGNFLLARRHEKPTARERAAALAESLSRDACQLLLVLLGHMAKADGHLDEREEQLLKEIGVALNLGTEAVSRLQTEGLPSLGQKALDDAGVPAVLIRLAQSREKL